MYNIHVLTFFTKFYKKSMQCDGLYDRGFNIIKHCGVVYMGNNDSLGKSEMAAGNQKTTFVVKIERCQNESWQGKVIWAEENRTVSFRSALELLRLMDEALAYEKHQQLEKTGTGS